MSIRVHGFSIQKEGNLPTDCEDAWAGDESAGLIALSDGASAGFDSQWWAQTLVDHFVTAPPEFTAEAVVSWLEALTGAWRRHLDWDSLPWYCIEKAREGSFATLLGLRLEPPSEAGGTCLWRAVALGDSCLFHVRGDDLLAAIPLANSSDFGNRPPLLSTDSAYNLRTLPCLSSVQGELNRDDILLLATDALAAWFLSAVERGERPWHYLADLTSESFPVAMGALRDNRAIQNDDATLVRISHRDPPEVLSGSGAEN